MSAFATRLTALALTCATCIAIVLAMPQPAGAFTATESRPPLPAPLAGKGEGAWAKAGHELRRVVAAYREHERQGVAAEFKPDNPSVRVAKGLVLVDAVASGDGAALLADLQLLGLRDGSRYGQVVSGWIPLGRMDAVVALSSLRSVSASLAPERNAATYGLVADRSGAIAMSADGLAQNGLTGTGVTVGVLSDTYDYNVATPDTTAAEDQANGDLPDGSSAFNGADVFVMAEGGNRGYDEGRAMMQLIHDVAPDSSLVFHSAFNGLADFASGIEELAAGDPLKGIPPARVIVDDVLYFAEPMFQDGIAAQAVDKVVGQGVAYFSAAGNAARSSYQAAFVDSGETFWICSFFSGPNCATDPAHNGGEYRGRLHDFDAAAGSVDFTQSIDIPAGRTVTLVLQWDQPFASASTPGKGSANDVDLYLLDQNGNIVEESSNDNLNGDPVEVIQFTADGFFYPGGTYQVAIAWYDGTSPDKPYGGPKPGMLKHVAFGNPTILEHATDSPTSYGHANAAGAEAVGAAFYQDTPRFGTSTPVPEPYSSAGGVPILFAADGTRLASEEVRQKPGLVAPDGTNTTFFYSDTTLDDDSWPNFFGTSAAAPHAASVAALMLQANGGLSPAAIYDAMEKSAIDMGDAGFDFDTGHGLVRGDAAVADATVNTPPTARISAACNGLSCDFDGSGSSDPDPGDGIAAYNWDFGDGGTAAAATTSHTYSSADTYAVTLTVTDNEGATGSASTDVTVSDPSAQAPPAAPSGVTASDPGNGTAVVAWLDNSGNESGFEVQRETLHKNGRWIGTTTVATTGPGVTGIVDPSGAGTFRYRVRAFNAVGSSAWSAWAEVTVTDTVSGGGGGGGPDCTTKPNNPHCG